MHTFIPHPQVAKVDIVQTLEGQSVVNGLYFRTGVEGGWDAPMLYELAHQVYTAWGTGITTWQCSTLTLMKVRATSMANQYASQAEYLPAPPMVGLVPGDAVPANVALCVSLGSAARGKAGRGRVYIAGLSEQHVTGSYVTANMANNITTGLMNLRDTLLLEGIYLTTYSRVVGGVYRAEALISDVVSIGVADLVVDSQRRRLPGRGA